MYTYSHKKGIMGNQNDSFGDKNKYNHRAQILTDEKRAKSTPMHVCEREREREREIEREKGRGDSAIKWDSSRS